MTEGAVANEGVMRVDVKGGGPPSVGWIVGVGYAPGEDDASIVDSNGAVQGIETVQVAMSEPLKALIMVGSPFR
jgi:hypothetical protein